MASTEATLAECALGLADVAEAVPLAEEAGWNQVAADWRLMLGEGRGVGMRTDTGRLVGTALHFPVGARLHWIGMVLTAKAWRHRGIGTRLLERCVAQVRETGAAAGLDATELGRPIYAGLGFKELYRLSRWHLPGPVTAAAAGVTVRPATAADFDAIAAFDLPRSFLRRRKVLGHLLGRAPALAQVAEAGGRLQGYALGRDGRIAAQIGPIVASNGEVAAALLAAASRALAGPFILDVPDRHAGLAACLRESGAMTPRGFFRMLRGEAPGLDDDSQVFALAGPELA